MLDDLRSTTETSDDHTIAAAQPLQPPIAVDGQCDPIQEDFYRFHAEAGQTLSSICEAHYHSARPALVAALARYNKLADASRMRAGQKLKLPPESELLAH